MLNPIVTFAGSVAALGLTVVADRSRRHRRGRALYGLAREARMNYSPLDRFDLAARLRAAAGWRVDTTDLRVRDVLYAARGSDRRFVATATRRHTPDARPVNFVIACVERLDSGAFREVAPRRATHGRDLLDAYRRALASFGPIGSGV